jgi:hypothetical protein
MKNLYQCKLKSMIINKRPFSQSQICELQRNYFKSDGIDANKEEGAKAANSKADIQKELKDYTKKAI